MNTNNYMYKIPDGISKSKLRIAIVMLNSQNIPKYGHLATMNNYMYSAKNGYDFIVEKQPLNIKDKWSWDEKNEYVLVWYKAEFIKRHLKNYHYILFIDSDAYFIDNNIKIEDQLISLLTNETCVLFQEDVWRSDFPETANVRTGEICAGLIFIKNCEESFRVLEAWSNAPYIDPDCEKYTYEHAREQDAIIVLRNKYPKFKEYINVVSAKLGIFGQYNSKWIIHLGGISKEVRTKYISDAFDNQLKNLI
jgi:hypothetical protein